jgi:uncharacterized membrane protein
MGVLLYAGCDASSRETRGVGQFLTAAAPSFLASLVEFVEASTIVLAVGATRGWRTALSGAFAGVAILFLAVAALGPSLARIPIASLQLFVGILLLFFGMRWLRKAILRYAGTIALHDEAAIYARQSARLETAPKADGIDWSGFATTLNAVVLEGLEVVFIVIAVGATAGALVSAAAGAAVAGAAVIVAGFALRAPLARVPENALKFAVGIMLSSFGTFWTGEGLRLRWPGEDAALPFLVAGFLAAALAGVAIARRVALRAVTA